MSGTRRRVVVVGAGGIGHPAVMALARADADLWIHDDDRVELGNLHRLPFATEADVGAPKGAVLLAALRAGGARATRDDRWTPTRVDPASATELFRGASVVLEGSDNFATKFLVADACGLLGVPSVHGAAVSWLGTVLPVVPGRGACYRCVFEDVPEGDSVDCATAGVMGPVTALVGALMAADTLRLLAGDHATVGSLARYDGFAQRFRAVPLAARPDCPLCGTHRGITDLREARYAAPRCD